MMSLGRNVLRAGTIGLSRTFGEGRRPFLQTGPKIDFFKPTISQSLLKSGRSFSVQRNPEVEEITCTAKDVAKFVARWGFWTIVIALADTQLNIINPKETIINIKQIILDEEKTILDAEQTICTAKQTILDAEQNNLDAEETILDAEETILNAEQTIRDADKTIIDAEQTICTAKWIDLSSRKSKLEDNLNLEKILYFQDYPTMSDTDKTTITELLELENEVVEFVKKHNIDGLGKLGR